MTKQKKS